MRNEELAKLIAAIHEESRGTYGWPRVHAELVLGLGRQVNRKRVARLMRQAGLQGIYRRKGRKNLVNAATEEDLVHRQFTVTGLDRLWLTDHSSVTEPETHPGWHRTGDVGHLDGTGRLWVEGRLVHVVSTAAGFVTPVGVEQRVETVPQVSAAAAVGVGPVGAQVLVLVVTVTGTGTGPLAGADLAASVRVASGVEVAAVLLARALPVDIRHNSKIDRARVAAWAESVLRGDVPRGGP